MIDSGPNRAIGTERGMLRRFTCELVYQNVKESQGKVGVAYLSQIILVRSW
jgi:hypothetical protein